MADEVREPLIPHTEVYDDDDDRANTKQTFQPEASCTPGPSGKHMETTTMNRPPKRGPRTAETSFIEGGVDSDTLKVRLANKTIIQEYPQYGKEGKFLTLKVSKGEVFVVGPKGGETRLFNPDGTINQKIPKTDMKILGPKRTEIIQQKDEDIEELEKTIQDRGHAGCK